MAGKFAKDMDQDDILEMFVDLSEDIHSDVAQWAWDVTEDVNANVAQAAEDVTEDVNAVSKALNKKAIKAIREEGAKTRAFGNGFIPAPWNILAGIAFGCTVGFLILFAFKVLQWWVTDHCRNLCLLNYVKNEDGIQIPMCEYGTRFFSRAFWFNGEGYFLGLSHATNDGSSAVFAAIILATLIAGIASATIFTIWSHKKKIE